MHAAWRFHFPLDWHLNVHLRITLLSVIQSTELKLFIARFTWMWLKSSERLQGAWMHHETYVSYIYRRILWVLITRHAEVAACAAISSSVIPTAWLVVKWALVLSGVCKSRCRKKRKLLNFNFVVYTIHWKRQATSFVQRRAPLLTDVPLFLVLIFSLNSTCGYILGRLLISKLSTML